jgi:hypothetical protein
MPVAVKPETLASVAPNAEEGVIGGVLPDSCAGTVLAALSDRFSVAVQDTVAQRRNAPS